MKRKSDEIISLDNVWKIYKPGQENQVFALKDVSLSIEKGDFVAVMGPSGSGKSTFMNMIGCLDVPTKGKIFLDKNDTSKFSESDLAQTRGRKIGFIFQQFNLIPNLTAKENVILPMIFQEADEFERQEKADHLLDLVELEERGNHYSSELSGGEQQRVAIARSLANDPEVLLADEPTGNLDTKTGKIVMDFLDKLNKEGKTIIMVTHDPDLAVEYARKVYWIKDGKIDKITIKEKNKWKTVKNGK